MSPASQGEARRNLPKSAKMRRSYVFVFIKAFNVTPEQILASLSSGFHFLLPYHNISLPVCILKAILVDHFSSCSSRNITHPQLGKKTQNPFWNQIWCYMDRVQGPKLEPCVNKSCLCNINQWGTRTALAGNLWSNPTAVAAAAPLSFPV